MEFACYVVKLKGHSIEKLNLTNNKMINEKQKIFSNNFLP